MFAYRMHTYTRIRFVVVVVYARRMGLAQLRFHCCELPPIHVWGMCYRIYLTVFVSYYGDWEEGVDARTRDLYVRVFFKFKKRNVNVRWKRSWSYTVFVMAHDVVRIIIIGTTSTVFWIFFFCETAGLSKNKPIFSAYARRNSITKNNIHIYL